MDKDETLESLIVMLNSKVNKNKKYKKIVILLFHHNANINFQKQNQGKDIYEIYLWNKYISSNLLQVTHLLNNKKK